MEWLRSTLLYFKSFIFVVVENGAEYEVSMNPNEMCKSIGVSVVKREPIGDPFVLELKAVLAIRELKKKDFGGIYV